MTGRISKRGRVNEGRPTKLTPEIKTEICDRIAKGESLIRILKSDDKFPHYSNVREAIKKDLQFRDDYAHAKEEMADYLAQEILDIADDGRNDWTTNDEGKKILDHEHVQRSRLRVDTRKWIASKLKPKKYGEKLELSGDKENPMQVEAKVKYEKMTVEELQRFLAGSLNKTG